MNRNSVPKYKITREQVYQFVVDYKTNHNGNSPNYREICAGVDGLADTSYATVKGHLSALAKAGRIALPDHAEARMIEVPGYIWVKEDDIESFASPVYLDGMRDEVSE